MKKNTLKKMILGLMQHLLAMLAFVAVATILFNSYLTVRTMDGYKTYALSPLDTEPKFEDSVLFQDIFQTAVADVTRLVVVKAQLESDGEFDSSKLIDVTEYAGRRGLGGECPVTAVYELEELIKWGKYGVEYTNRAMSMSDFVNYFGPAVSPDNFVLDGNGQLQFAGFLDVECAPRIKRVHSNTVTEQTEDTVPQEKEAILAAMEGYSEEQLEDMAFSYIMAKLPENSVDVSREDDGSVTVYFLLLNGRYETIDKEKQLTAYAGNWVDYMQLQANVADTIEGLAASYQMYQNSNSLYQTNSNLKYAVRVMTEDGMVHTYTNLEEMEEQPDNSITDFFSEYRRYFIYYPDSLEFMGNTSLTEDDIIGYLSDYRYAYPDSTHIWVGVDTTYAAPGDAFYSAHVLFENIVPNITIILVIILLLLSAWMAIAVYLTVMAGVAYNAEEEPVYYLNAFDHMWTELVLLLGYAAVWGGRYGYQFLRDIAGQVHANQAALTMGISAAPKYEYICFAAYGFVVSLVICTFWYSMVRRAKSHNFWKDSFLHWLIRKLHRALYFVLLHRNSAVSTLIPYNAFLLVNLCGICGSMVLWKTSHLVAVLLASGVILLDGLIGVMMFRRNGEWLDIVEGIKRIGDGEVEYKLDMDSLHGANREIAEAVNNIGDGIHKAVNTSMKDEQMKTDLITNVSHDIKTPLTSIINYVDLLKRLKIQEEPARGYIEVLDAKSQRLKQLTDDLVEASKLSSGNIEFQMERLNLNELLMQVVGEISEHLDEKKLQIVFDGGNTPIYIYADSHKMWRVMENLFNNVYKYAMENTRVYLDLAVVEGENGNQVETSVKNISERQMNMKADDLTERFIRGDASRTSEGSGLGLYITKSLVEGQNGHFSVYLDGDLFKAVIRFPEYVEQTVQE